MLVLSKRAKHMIKSRRGWSTITIGSSVYDIYREIDDETNTESCNVKIDSKNPRRVLIKARDGSTTEVFVSYYRLVDLAISWFMFPVETQNMMSGLKKNQ